MEVKRCFKCGKVKPLSEFYAHKEMADGHLNKCKTCTRKDVRNHEEQSPESVLRSRLSTCKKNPTGINARRVVEAAIRAGKLVRPNRCSGCGCDDSEHRIEAHHCDYTRPLDVIWLCTPCHRRMDAQRRIREGKKPYSMSKEADNAMV